MRSILIIIFAFASSAQADWSSKAFYDANKNPGAQREAAVVKEILKGNVPSWCKKEAMIQVGSMKVTPGPFAIGTDADFVRVPLTPYAIQYVATKLGYKIPTPKLVDMIWRQSVKRLAPITTTWNYVDNTGTLGYRFYQHSQMIDAKIADKNYSILIGGLKKDVVSDVAKLRANPHHVVIYGWHNLNGSVIQPETAVHDWNYSDYSHGFEFVIGDDPTLAGPCSLDAPPAEFLKAVQ